MNNNTVAKLRSARSAVVNNAPAGDNIQHILTCRPLSQRRPLARPAPMFDSAPADELHTHSILVNNAARRRGFLPYYYRTANTFESIRRQRVHVKPAPKASPTFLPLFKRSGARSAMTDHLSSVTSELTELNLVMHDKVMSFSAMDYRPERETEFVTEIPNTLELVVQTSPRKSTMERSLLETLQRQRSEHLRYRTLPVSRAPYA